jgi:hypothetical protein
VRDDRFRLVRTRKDTLLYDMSIDPFQKNNIYSADNDAGSRLLTALSRWENELVSEYKPVTTIEAGFPEERSFTLPVQDASLSGKIKYSSIHPNQSHTENWIQNGDSIFWKLKIINRGKYRIELKYACPASETGSRMFFSTSSGSVDFTIDKPFESSVLPQRDYVKRSESVERTWSWMDIGIMTIEPGQENIVLKLLKKKNSEAGLVKAIRFTQI